MSPTMWEDEFSKGTGWLLIEFPEFSRSREDYFQGDEDYASAQSELTENPKAGDAMPDSGRKRDHDTEIIRRTADQRHDRGTISLERRQGFAGELLSEHA